MQNDGNACACGCGGTTRPGNRYVHGHNRRGERSWSYREEDRGFTTPCWIWQLALSKAGYGVYGGGSGDERGLAHRWYWAERNGPVPDGLELDHLCRVRACVNPDHLEPVTHRENCRRAIGAGRPATYTLATRFLIALADSSTTLRRKEIADMCGVSPTYVTTLLGRRA
jgi:hypothetical protein